MSKFEELRQSYVDARAGFFAQRNACTNVAAMLLQGLEAHIQSPSFQFQFMPHTGEVSTSKNQTAKTAAWFAPDGCWHYLVGLQLSDATPGAFTKDAARQVIVAELILRPEAEAFSVRIKGWDDQFTLPSEAGSPEQAAFNEFVFQRMVDSYQKAGQRFFEGQDDTARMVSGRA